MIYATSQASACKWHEAPVNSYLTGASPICLRLRSHTGAVLDCSLRSLVMFVDRRRRMW